MPDTANSTIYEFGEFRLDAESCRLCLRETGKSVQFQPKTFELLNFLCYLKKPTNVYEFHKASQLEQTVLPRP